MATVIFLVLFFASSALAGLSSIDSLPKGISGKAADVVVEVEGSKFLSTYFKY